MYKDENISKESIENPLHYIKYKRKLLFRNPNLTMDHRTWESASPTASITGNYSNPYFIKKVHWQKHPRNWNECRSNTLIILYPYGRRIVQIMIQATDLAQILYRGHPLRKKRGPRKISIWPPFSKMAAMGYPEILYFALNGQQMAERDNYENRFYVLSIANVQMMP